MRKEKTPFYKKQILISLIGTAIIAMSFNGCSFMQDQNSTEAATTSDNASVTQEVTQEQTTQTITEAQTSETESQSEVKSDDWLTINSIEKQTNGFSWIEDCTYSDSDYSFDDVEMEGPVLYGSIELSIDESEISVFNSSLILPDGSTYNGYDFMTRYSGKMFAASIPKNLPAGDYSFELHLFRGNEEEITEENDSLNTVKFTING